MTYSAWLIEVDEAFEKANIDLRVRDISPNVLLREYEAGTTPNDFVKLPYSAFFEKSVYEGGSSADFSRSQSGPESLVQAGIDGANSAYQKVKAFLIDTSVLDSLNRVQASFVVRCMTGLGWLCFCAAALALVMRLAIMIPGFGVEVRQARSGSDLIISIEAPWRSWPYLQAALSFFLAGLSFWWGSAILRGFYFMLGRNQTPP